MESTLVTNEVTDKIFELFEEFNRYVFANPEILDEIPDKAELVFLDADDPAFNEANIQLANSNPRPSNGPRVYIKMRRRVRMVERIDWEPEVLLAAQ
jgi:hypothetical protein